MKVLIFSCCTLLLLTTACGERSNHAFYDLIHERERQECLRQGRHDCHRVESYDDYKAKRDETIK